MANYNPTTVAQLISDIESARSTAGNHTITLVQNGTYTLTDAYTDPDSAYNYYNYGSPNALPHIEGDITIIGQGATIERDTGTTNDFRMFQIRDDSVIRIEDVIFRNFNGSGGGVIYMEQPSDGAPSTLRLTNCQFYDNGDSDGGVILADFDSFEGLLIDSCLFDGNVVSNHGGVVTAYQGLDGIGVVRARNSTFRNNEAVSGSVFYLHASPIYVELNCLFEFNTAGEGAIYGTVESAITILDSTFSNNIGTFGGGAIHGELVQNVHIYNTDFESNTSQATSFGGGGAIKIGTGQSLKIERSLFNLNSASDSDGGAIAVSFISKSLQLLASTVSNNDAEGTGGGLYLSYAENLLIQGTLFSGNQATAAAAIELFGSSVAQILNSRFENHTVTAQPTFTATTINSTAGGIKEINFNEFESNNGVSGMPVIRIFGEHDATNNWWGASGGPSGVTTGSGDYLEAPINYYPYISQDPTEIRGSGFCPICYTGFSELMSTNPIALIDGEKRQRETDIRVQTPMGELAFTRTYEQRRQDIHRFMGLGWNHIHRAYLEEESNPARITVVLAQTETYFDRVGTPMRFEGVSGSVSYIEKDTSGALPVYTLTASDESVYRFDIRNSGDPEAWLTSRTLPTGEVWSYSYDSNNNLLSVGDGYGRALNFAYYSGLSGADAFKNGQLWRVGTHTSSDLVTSPQTPYIELDYTDDGNGAALLTDVQDVRGNDWSYRYYGSEVGETDSKWLNFMVERKAPLADTDGDGIADTIHLLEQLTYDGTSRDEITAIVQSRGDGALVNTLTFATDTTTESLAGRNTVHHFANQSYQGTEDPAQNMRSQSKVNNQRAATQEDANGNRTGMKWDGSGKLLEEVVDALNNHTRFYYDPQDRIFSSIDAEGRTKLYEYSGASRQPSEVRVIDGQNLIQNGNMDEDSDWLDLSGNVPDLNDQRPRLGAGRFTYYVDSDAASEGIEGQPWDIVNGNDYTVRAYVHVISGTVTLQVTGSAGISVDSSGTGWQLLEVAHSATANETAVKAQLLAKNGAAEFYVDYVSIREDDGVAEIELAINGAMEIDAAWQSIVGAAPVTFEHSSRQSYTRKFARLVRASNSGEGITSSSFTVVEGQTLHLFARVRPVSGAVRMSLSSTSNVDVVSANGSGEWELLEIIYTIAPGEDGNTTLQFLADSSNAAFYVDAVYVLDAEMMLRHQEFVYDSKDRVLNEKLIEPSDGVTLLQEIRRVYGDQTSGNAYGLLESITVKDLEDPLNDQTTVYTYDEVGRVVKTNKTSMLGSCQFSYTVYDEAGNVVASLCSTASYTPPTTVAEAVALYDANDAVKKHNRVTTHEYDELGRKIETTIDAGATFVRTSRTLYDALGRVTRSIQNYVAQGSSAPGDWVFENGQWRDGVGGNPILHGDDLDQNLISDTVYNARGLVALRQDVLGRVMLYGYDLADRLVKTVQNAQTPDYDASYTTGDPNLSAYTEDTSIADGDVITEQVYDAAGNLVQSIDARGISSFTIYDALNRPVKTVQNAKATATIALNPGDTGYDAALDPRSASYVISTEADRDQISTTEYDSMGRVVRTARLLENRGASEEWDEQYMVYDALGRQVRSIQHYVEQVDSSSAVVTTDNWVWSASNARWELSATDTTPVDLGDNDQNIISETVYDNQGRVRETLDVNRVLTRMVYDGLNRQVKTVSNYVAQATDPAEWVWSATNERWELSSTNTTAVDHGANNDQNIISETIYDSDGRVEGSRDVEGLLSRNAYDSLGRQVLAVQNFVDNSYADPANWVWDTGQTPHRWEDGSGTAIDRGTGFDQNLIRQPEYDDENRVFQTRDVRGNLTRQVYDASGRQVMSIANYVPQATEPENWVWSDTNDRWEDGSGLSIDFGIDNDQNRISRTTYDLLGRVASNRDAAGRETVFVYDGLNRRVRAVNNYRASSNPTKWVWSTSNDRWEVSDSDTTAVDHGADFDRNHISDTIYNKAGQVTESRDTRGTLTAFSYDDAGRRLQVTRASGTVLASTSYTCFDKAGRVLKQIANYVAQGSSDPYNWVLESGDWKQEASGTAIVHGTDNDENLIMLMAYDQASRRISMTNAEGDVSTTTYFLDGQVDSMTDPEGTVTIYRYDALRRRTKVVQSYINLSSQYTDPSTWTWNGSDWEDDASTPVTISHGTDKDENIIVAVDYDMKGRMTQMRDPRGEVSSYEYDALGRRTKLTNPLMQDWITAYAEADGATETTMTYPGVNGGSSYDVVRSFDRMGRLQSIDYGDPANTYDVQMAYDVLGNRLSMRELGSSAALQRETRYSYDEANRLQEVGFDTNGDSSIEEAVHYSYDNGGNRTRLRLPDGLEVTYSYDEKGRLQSLSDWDSQQSDFSYDGADRHIQTERDSTIRSSYTHDLAGRLTQLHHEDVSGTPATLAQYDFSVDGRGNRTQINEQILQVGGSTPVSTTIDYSYDALSRLKQADYDSGTTVYNYGYDVAGNLVNMNGVTRSYNAANQMTNDGTNTLTYDANGNLTNDGVSAYTWNRANRMVSNGSHSYVYDGNGNRIQQTVSSVVTDYLLDLQPALAKVIGDSDGNRFVHGPRGIHMQQGVTVGAVPKWGQVNWGAFNWGSSVTLGTAEYLLQDGLGSIRSVVDASATVLQTHSYDPYGNYLGTAPTDAYFGFTGEQTDGNKQVYLRARYYSPQMGVFSALDWFEGMDSRPMSLNGYSWVEGNVPNDSDPSGMVIRSEVETGQAIYSCNCGWIDLRHANPKLAIPLMAIFSHATNPSVYQYPNSKGMVFEYTLQSEAARIMSQNPPYPTQVAAADLAGVRRILPLYHIPKDVSVNRRNLYVTFCARIDETTSLKSLV